MKGIILQYKGFIAFARYYPEDGYYHGSLEGIQAYATFGGESIEDVTRDYHDMIDDYLSGNEVIHPENDRKLVIDMSDYPFQSDQAVSLQFAEASTNDAYSPF